MKDFLTILFIITVIIGAPLASIASVNLLFNTNIPFNFSTFFAAMWLNIIVGGGMYMSKNK
jgi:hypothetical protein